MEKKIQVVMLASDKESTLHLFTGNKQGLYLYPENMSVIPKNPHCLNQHLYFLSDDEIKEGDWYYTKNADGVYINKCCKLELKKEHIYYLKSDNCKKIITLTDKSLKLPEPSKEWIEYFVSEYNKGNIITEVTVEYISEYFEGEEKPWITWEETRLKTKADNTINIKMKETWYDIVNKFTESGRLRSTQAFIEWLEENNYQIPKQIK